MKIFCRPSRPGERWKPSHHWFAWLDGESAGDLAETPEAAVNKVLAGHPRLQKESYEVVLCGIGPSLEERKRRQAAVRKVVGELLPYEFGSVSQ